MPRSQRTVGATGEGWPARGRSRPVRKPVPAEPTHRWARSARKGAQTMATEAANARVRPESRKSPGQAAHPALSAQRSLSAPQRICAVPHRSDRPGRCSRYLLEQSISPAAIPRQAISPRPSHHPKGAIRTRDDPSVADLVARRSSGKPGTAALTVNRQRGRDTGSRLGRRTGLGSGPTGLPACRAGRRLR